MSWNDIKLDPADTAFSKYVRLVRKRCEYCNRPGEGRLGIDGLQASHFYSRKKETVRFDLENVDVLCIWHHKLLGTDNKQLYEEWKIKKLGQRAFDILKIRAYAVGKKERELQKIYWRKRLKDEFGIS